MAVVPGYVGSATITWAGTPTASVVGQSIGTASWDRLVVVAVTLEETATIDSCTIAGIAATLGISVRNTTGAPDNAVAFFYAYVPTGTTATIAVTLSGNSSLAGRISVWATTGAAVPHSDSNSAQGSGANQALGGVTIPTNGAGYWVFNNATAATAVTWTNATERDDTATATYRHSVADAVAAGTPTVTADGATTNQILAGIAFSEAPPAMGWDRDPVNSITKAVKSVSPVSIALAASGAILAPYPYFQAPPAAATHASTITDQVITRSLYYQSKIAPPPVAPPVVAPTTMDWQPQTNRAAPPTKSRVSNVTYTLTPPKQEYSVFSVETSYRATKSLHYQDKFETPTPGQVDGTVTIDKWQQPLSIAVASPPAPPTEWVLFAEVPPFKVNYGWYASLSRATRANWPAKILAQPFVPKEATAENTVTIDKWLQPLGRAAPLAHLWLENVTYINIDYFINNTETIDKWQFNWQGPPRYWPPKEIAQPFVPKEATSENTVDISNWQQPLSEAVPHGWPPYAPVTVPYFPYLTGDNTGTAATWFSWWGGPPRFWPAKPMALPFWPKEATSENTVTSDKWLVDLSRAARRTRSLPAQYQFPFTAFAQFTVAWQQPLSTPIVKARRVSQQTVASYPTPPFFPNTVTVDKWQQPLGRATPVVRLNRSNIIYARLQPAIIANTVTIDKWGQPLSRSVTIKGPVYTAPRMYALQVIPVEAPVKFVQIVVHFNLLTALHYQDITKVITPPPAVVVPPVVGKGWTLESPSGQVWTMEEVAVCGVDEDGAFQEDAFQADAFQVVFSTEECWTIELPPVNTWEEEEPDP